jgi:hypothetical protein
MAGIEKVDEVSGEYCGWEMYGYKRDHIQVSPKNRKLFKHQPAILVIFKSSQGVYQTSKYGYTHIQYQNYNKHLYEKINKKWHTWVSKKYSGVEILKPISVLSEYDFCLYVPGMLGEVDGKYWNYTTNIGNIKRRLNRMLGYKVQTLKVNMTHREFYTEYKSSDDRSEFFNKLFTENYHG